MDRKSRQRETPRQYTTAEKVAVLPGGTRSESPKGPMVPPAVSSEGPGSSAAGHSMANPTPASRPILPRITRQRITLAGMGAVVVAAGALALGRWTAPGSESGPASAAHERTAIAVLPFQNLSPEGPHPYLAAALGAGP